MIRNFFILSILITSIISCKKEVKSKNQKLDVITTTSMITDLVKNIGGNLIEVKGLMGSGVDPHLYKASEGDVSKLVNADVIFYNGLHLEGKLVEVFEKMKHQDIQTIAIGESLDKNILIGSDYFASNYDPHIWFSVKNWKTITRFVIDQLKTIDPKNAEAFEANGKSYLAQLEKLETELKNTITTLPKEKRILVTAHDAFSYFGKAYDFNVVGLQGLSTATEAGVQDVQKLANFIIENKVKAIFVETSVPKRTIEALQAAVKSKGHEVTIGGTLFSDALGNKGTKEGTYIGMFRHNVNTIVNALR
ncbi:metal ABC transporter solute-binding protein, Zn/Mn family [Aquimarina sediminis]|uniref:metal ABC transporter solute-binding protein, Zn/Mn family n=1 Tax=Aquimarina sediminis TaxID=2070536 RepID=UPI000CA04A83|nr:zinc ABC transporter substrate-binding protein [Aquimarina sediminis]